jgi:LysM repeat protein
MVDPRDGNREDFIINENYAPAEEVDLSREEYYERPSGAFKKKSITPFVIGGLGLVVLVVIFVLIFSRPKNIVDQEYLQSLETRMQQLEKKLATIGVMDQIIERLGKQEQDLDRFDKKTDRFESTVTTQIDQIIKELGALHRKTSQLKAAAAPQPKTPVKKQPVASKKVKSTAKFHQVQPGETLYRISRRYGLSVEQLRSYNDLSPNTAIYPGQKLMLTPKPNQ